MVCGYTKGVETQLSKLYFLVEFDEISKVFETKSVCRSMLVCICVLVCVGELTFCLMSKFGGALLARIEKIQPR